MRTSTFFRGAQKGLDVMNCGSFYTPCVETAESYAYNSEECVYSFDLSVRLFDVTPFMSICDFDNGLREIFEILSDEEVNIEELYSNFDGFRIDCGHTWLVILFGKVDVKTSVITKLSFEEMLIEDELFQIIK
jgi:hypothetical protein